MNFDSIAAPRVHKRKAMIQEMATQAALDCPVIGAVNPVVITSFAEHYQSIFGESPDREEIELYIRTYVTDSKRFALPDDGDFLSEDEAPTFLEFRSIL